MLTKGNIEVEKIKVGDIHYEYEYGFVIKCEVLTLPVKNEEKHQWSWTSRNIKTGKIIDYLVTEGCSQYAPNLYDCEAYLGCTQI